MTVVGVAIAVVVVLVVAMLVQLERSGRDADRIPDEPRPDEEPAGTLYDIRGQMRGIARRQDHKFARNLTVMGLGVIVALIAVGVAHASSQSAIRANRALAAYKVASQEVRVGACEQYNAHEAAQAEIEVGESHDQIALFAAAAGTQDTGRVQAFVADYNRKHDAKIRAVHHEALRDCSARGIQVFLKGTK